MNDLLKRLFSSIWKRFIPGWPVILYFPQDVFQSSFLVTRKGSDQYVADDRGLPVPPPHLWQGYGQSVEEHLKSGEEHVTSMLDILREGGFTLRRGNRVLDFGCATGRMMRWLKGPIVEGEIWGVDVSAEHISWCMQNFPPPFYFAPITTLPHLPFEDGYFDLIYAGSVFTHIEDLAFSWLLELRRILSKEGMLYVTIHDEKTIEFWENYCRDIDIFKRIMADPIWERYTRSDFAMFSIGRSVFSQVFYSSDYFREMAQSILRVVSMKNYAYGYQTAVLLAKK